MCGRYASFRSAQDLADAFDVEQITDAAAAVAAGYNIAPTDPVRVVLDRSDRSGESTGAGGQVGATNDAGHGYLAQVFATLPAPTPRPSL